ncbi:cobalamin biosynthesis protein CobW [Myxosarcina sp. GI1]|uniref:cobalamin biosynthesis protein CobW n=1 Tax=Myxosarcina sp. GI1 TaxID=1541065 RepID=UPI000561650D|nr:cobalamin biosynthesis protein CobW [Myxosarcina sp. GI1]
MHKIPVTVISGFLGAGKTTLVRHLLQNNQGRKIAVIVNEFGEVGIDGDLLRSCQVCDEEETPDGNIIELTNGCLCCTVQEEFYPTMQELLKRRDKIDCLLIETSGLALPKPLVRAFSWFEIRNSATVDGVVTVVDCQALANGAIAGDLAALEAQRQADPNLEHETPLEELFEDQLACADLVLLTKTDLVNAADVERIKTLLKQDLSPRVKIVVAERGQIAADLLLGFNAAVEDNLSDRPSHHDDEADHEHDDDIKAVEIVCDRSFEPNILIERLQQLLLQHEIYRIKGFVNVATKPMRLVIQGVGNRFDRFYDRLWQGDELRQTRLVVIGRNLEREQVEAAILNE